MGWLPLLFITRITHPQRCDDPLARAKEVLISRGAVLLQEEQHALRFRPSVGGFFFTGPFALLTNIRIRTERAHSTLTFHAAHPIDPLLFTWGALSLPGDHMVERIWLFLLLFGAQSTIRFFMLRDLVQRISNEDEPRSRLVKEVGR